MSAVIHRFGAVTVYLGHQSGKYPDGNQVLVHGQDAVVAFDTPMVARTLNGVFDEVQAVILGHVHEDHLAGLSALPPTALWVHEGDLQAAQSWEGMSAHFGYAPEVLTVWRERMEREFHYKARPDAQAYADGQTWSLGGSVQVRAHHLPGHTSGHCALLVESEGVAFIGDIDLSGFGPYYGDATSSLSQFRASLRAVRELDARVWVTSHHRGVVTSRQDFDSALSAFAARIDQRNEKLLGMLRQEPQSLESLVQTRLAYPPGFESAFVNDAERRMIEQHLNELIQAGEVRSVEGESGAIFCVA